MTQMEMKRNKYTKKELVAFVKALLELDKACAICIDMCESEAIVRLERKSASSLVLKLVNGFESDSADYEVNADTLLEYDTRRNCVYLKVAEEHGDPVPFWLHFMKPVPPASILEGKEATSAT